MVIYLDLVILLNSLADAVILFLTARLSGISLRKRKLLSATLLGSFYSLVSLIAPTVLQNAFVRLFVSACMVRIAYGRQKMFFRILIVYYIISFVFGGMIYAFSASVNTVNILENLNWNVFVLVTLISFCVLTILFRGTLRHNVNQEISSAKIERCGKNVSLQVLFDTGHTLHDPCSGDPVLTVWAESLMELLNEEERSVIGQLETLGSLGCMEQLHTISPGMFRVIPYRAVGVDRGHLLAFRADSVQINRICIKQIVIALSPTPVSDGGGYTALWGGEGGRGYDKSNGISVAACSAACGIDPPG